MDAIFGGVGGRFQSARGVWGCGKVHLGRKTPRFHAIMPRICPENVRSRPGFCLAEPSFWRLCYGARLMGWPFPCEVWHGICTPAFTAETQRSQREDWGTLLRQGYGGQAAGGLPKREAPRGRRKRGRVRGRVDLGSAVVPVGRDEVYPPVSLFPLDPFGGGTGCDRVSAEIPLMGPRRRGTKG